MPFRSGYIRTAVEFGNTKRPTEGGIEEDIKKVICARIPGRMMGSEVGYKYVQSVDEHLAKNLF